MRRPAGRWMAAASEPGRPADGAVAGYGTIGRRQRREAPRGLPAPYGLLLPDTSSGGQAVRAVTFTGAGGNEVVAVVERPDPVPTADEILVAARFAGVNWADVSQRQGHYPPPPGAPRDIPGLEVAGEVAATGEPARGGEVGARGSGRVGGGGRAARVGGPGRHATAVPPNLPDGTGAAVRGAYITAHDAVFTKCGLERGE